MKKQNVTNKKTISPERGHVLVLVLIFMCLGSILIAALLSFISSGIRIQSGITNTGDELYAADAGVRDALWEIKYNDLDGVTGYDPFDYDTEWTYNLSENINNLPVTISTIQNVWLPGDNIDLDDDYPSLGSGELADLVSTGNTQGLVAGDTGYTGGLYITGTADDVTTSVPASSNFHLKISYNGDYADDLNINQIGIWIPDGFSYVTHSCELENASGMTYDLPDSTPTPGTGGKYVVWDYSAYPFAGSAAPLKSALPHYTNSGTSSSVTINMKIVRDTTTAAGKIPDIISWVVTDESIDYLPFAWDNDIQVYHVRAIAGSTTVEAYTIKSELREMAAAISGDYYASGQSVMVDTNSVPKFRELLLTESTSDIDAIPDNATVAAAYLYWSGWINNYGNGIFWDQCDYNYLNDKWTKAGNWSIQNSGATGNTYTDEYRGTGGAIMPSLTLKNSLDLSGLAGSATISWDQTLYGTSTTSHNVTTVPTGDGDILGNWTGSSGSETTITHSPSSNTGSAWTSPTGAYTNGVTSASITSGSPSGSNSWGDYGFQLSGKTVTAVEVSFDAWATGSTAVPTFVAAGTFTYDTGSISPPLPTGWAQNDIFLLFLETANQPVTAPSGWTAVTNSPQGTGTAGSTTATSLFVFWKRAGSSESNPTVSFSGNHIVGRILAFRGCVTTGNPWDVTAGNTAAAGTGVTIPGVTTTTDNCLIVLAVANGIDVSSTAQISGWSNAGLTGLTELVDNNRTSGNGGGFGVAAGTKASAGIVNSTTATLAAASVQGRMCIALKPASAVNEQIEVEISGDGGSSWATVATETLTSAETTYGPYDVTEAFGTDYWNADTLDDGYLMVRASAITVGSPATVYLDYLPVSVTYIDTVLYSNVDETSPGDGDYITGASSSTTGNYYALLTFNAADFDSIPADATITNLTIYYRAVDVSSNTNNIRAAIAVSGTVYHTTDSGNNPGSSFATYNYAFTTNPVTGDAWTVADIKGTGDNPLEQFGVGSTDLNPGIRVSLVYAQVNYTTSTDKIMLAISKNGGAYTDLAGFAASGNSSYTLEQASGYVGSGADDIKIKLYTTGFTIATKYVDIDNILITDDTSTEHYDTSVSLDINGSGKETVTIGSSAKDVSWAEVNASGRAGTATAINGNYHFTVTADPGGYGVQAGDYVGIEGADGWTDDDWYLVTNYSFPTITLARAYTGPTVSGQSYYVFDGYFYACKADVTNLVTQYSNGADFSDMDNPIFGNGNGTFTVGDVFADTNSVMNPGWLGDASFAGWSLVIIYSSPETKGHQLFIYDPSNGYARAVPSGTTIIDTPISGFIVPEQISGEDDSDDVTRLTIFVGEGDLDYNDYVAFIPPGTSTEHKLWDRITCANNSSSNPTNAFNSRFIDESSGLESAKPGVDIDTFHITWGQGYLSPGDTSATIRLNTGEGYVLVFMIVSFRSETTTGGTISYLIE